MFCIRMTHSSQDIWIFWSEVGVANLLHEKKVCLCTHTKKRTNNKCDAFKIVDIIKNIPRPSDLISFKGWNYVSKQLFDKKKKKYSKKSPKAVATSLHYQFKISKLTLTDLGKKLGFYSLNYRLGYFQIT